MNGFIRRFSSLVYKETLQVLRDPSTILLGVVLPIPVSYTHLTLPTICSV